MSMATKKEITKKLAREYGRASKKAKGRLLEALHRSEDSTLRPTRRAWTKPSPERTSMIAAPANITYAPMPAISPNLENA